MNSMVATNVSNNKSNATGSGESAGKTTRNGDSVSEVGHGPEVRSPRIIGSRNPDSARKPLRQRP